MEHTGVVLAAAGGTASGGRERHRRKNGRAEQHGEKGVAGSGEEQLARLVRERGGYNVVEVGYQRSDEQTIREAVEKVVAQGAERVIVVPTVFTNADLTVTVTGLKERYPDVEITYTGQPMDPTKYADLIISKIREHDTPYVATEAELGLVRLSALRTEETAVVYDFVAGHTLVSRLSALGFTPDTRVTMLQNFGHGPLIVSVRDTRIALGRGEAGKIRVRRPESD